MRILRNIRQVFTGRTDVERKQEQLANAQIRKEALAEQLRVRREHAVKYAGEAERLKYQQKIKQLRQPKQSYGGFGLQSNEYRDYGSAFGQPRIVKQRVITRTIGKGKKKRKVKRTIRTAPQYKFDQIAETPRRFDILGM